MLLHSSFPDRSAKDGLDGGFSKDFEAWLAPTLIKASTFSLAMETTEKLVSCHSFTCETGVSVLTFPMGRAAELMLHKQLAAASSRFRNSTQDS